MSTAAPTSPPALLVTKLRPPQLGRDFVPRPRLLDRLLDGLDRPLTLVTAPAGFGKTTLLAAAVANSPQPWGWVSLDEMDNHLPTFLEHLVGALRTAVPDACRTTLSYLRQSKTPSVDLLARTLVNELADLPCGSLLVLDEYDVIQNPLVAALLDSLLRHPTSDLHLAIAARATPALPLARLRARGQVTEIDAQDLRFTRAEAQAFLERTLGAAVSDEAVAALAARTEGWIAGLRLLIVAGGQRPDPARLPSILAGPEPRVVREFLLDEVLARQSPAVQDFLLQSALFERFCAPLCDAVITRPEGAASSQAVLAQPERANLFLVALDAEGEWYRYHSLFRDALRQRLEAGGDVPEPERLHARASAWFTAHGLVEEAIHHALLAGNAVEAAELVEAQAPAALNQEEWFQADGWLRRLHAAEGIQERPGLLLARAWTLHLSYRLDEIPALLERAEVGLGHTPPPPDDAAGQALWAQIQTLRSGALIGAGEFERALACARYGWAHLPAGYLYARRVALTYLAVAAQALGQGESLRPMLEAEGASDLGQDTVYRQGVLHGRMYLDLAEGALHRVEEGALRALAAGRERGLELSATWAHYLLGRVRYEWDDVATAEQHFRAVIERRDRAHFLALQGSYFGLALTHQALGQPERARAQMEALIESAPQTWSLPHLAPLRAFRAHVALRRGDLATAMRWLPPTDAPPVFYPSFVFGIPDVTLAWVRLVLGTEASLAQAHASLAALERAYTGWHDALHLTQVLALQALVAQAQGEPERALSVLARAIALAAPGGLVRTFVDFGPPMAQLLGQLVARPEPSEHLSRVQLAFGSNALGRAAPIAGRHPALLEPLTPREMEVVKLLERRLTDREIGSALHISVQTVFKHTANIYQKLQVSGRREAVARARELGLLAAE